MKTVTQHETIHRQPKESGYYNTSNGYLFWIGSEFRWTSHKNDLITISSPKYWYEETDLLPLFKSSLQSKLTPFKELIKCVKWAESKGHVKGTKKIVEQCESVLKNLEETK